MLELELFTGNRKLGIGLLLAPAGFKQQVEVRTDIAKGHTILRTFRSGHGRAHLAEIEFQSGGELRVGRVGVAPHALRLAVGLDQRDALFIAACQAQVIDGHLVDREKAAGGAIFRGHVADGGAVGQRQVIQAGAEELDELSDHAVLAQHLRYGQHQVGGGDTLVELAGQAEADHFRDQHRHRLAEHCRLGLDTTNAPAKHTEAIDHGGVRVGADQGVRIGIGFAVLFTGPDHLAEVFQIHLVADAGARWHHGEVVECLLAPAQELVALAVALHLDRDVLLECLIVAETVDHHRVVDDQVHRRQRIDLLRIAAGLGHGVAHGCKIDDCRDAGEVLHQYAGRAVLDLHRGAARIQPAHQGFQVVGADCLVVFPAQQVLQQHLQ